MLTHIHIENYTIIDTLDLDFRAGMSVLTGETGAGKSIMIDALDLVLGGRADSKAIRIGQERCDITAGFDLQNIPAAKQWLATHEFEQMDDCLLRRTIATDGRSRCYINNKPVPLQSLRAIGTILVNIHGQHEHQSLLKRDAQREMLDTFANHSELVSTVAACYQAWADANHRLTTLTSQSQDQTAKADLLRYQIQELDELGINEHEIIELEKEHKQLANAENLITQSQHALALLDEDEQGNALLLLNSAVNILTSFQQVDPKIHSSHELLINSIVQVQEAINELRHYLAQAEIDPQRLAWVEQRLQKIYDVARKHRIAPENLYEHHQQLIQELKNYTLNDEQLTELKLAISELTSQYLTAATKLTRSRAKATKQLSQLVTQGMQQLGMPGGTFTVNFEAYPDEQFSPKGRERVDFLVSTNPGQALQALNKVVSGGELSRISLAIQVITAQKDTTPTLIFDEVDVGIGGSTAAIVGQLLRQLSAKVQVLCITHLPQVAACGHQHYQVKKSSQNELTTTEIQLLTAEQKVQEIARMLGGLKITAQTMAHAREMLELV